MSLAQQVYMKTYNISHVVAGSDSDFVASNGVRYATLGDGTSLMASPTEVPDGRLDGPADAFNRTDPGLMLQETQKLLQIFT